MTIVIVVSCLSKRELCQKICRLVCLSKNKLWRLRLDFNALSTVLGSNQYLECSKVVGVRV